MALADLEKKTHPDGSISFISKGIKLISFYLVPIFFSGYCSLVIGARLGSDVPSVLVIAAIAFMLLFYGYRKFAPIFLPKRWLYLLRIYPGDKFWINGKTIYYKTIKNMELVPVEWARAYRLIVNSDGKTINIGLLGRDVAHELVGQIEKHR